MTRTSLRALLRRAARLLVAEAAVAREACQVGRPGHPVQDWACADCNGRTCRARKMHDRHLATAKELRDAAVKGIRG